MLAIDLQNTESSVVSSQAGGENGLEMLRIIYCFIYIWQERNSKFVFTKLKLLALIVLISYIR